MKGVNGRLCVREEPDRKLDVDNIELGARLVDCNGMDGSNDTCAGLDRCVSLETGKPEENFDVGLCIEFRALGG